MKPKVRGRVPLPHHDVLLSADAQAAHDAGARRFCARRSSPPSAGRGITCSSTRRRRRTRRCPKSWRARARVPHLRSAPRSEGGRASKATCAIGRSARTGFIDDLRTARGVIASGGFTLMGEAVYLRRPMLAMPIGGQFEQVLNARYLEAEGYGLGADELTTGAAVGIPRTPPRFRAQAGRLSPAGQCRIAREARRYFVAGDLVTSEPELSLTRSRARTEVRRSRKWLI